jgi:alpha-L-rhamnosidase
MKNLYHKSWIVSNLLPVLTMLLLWGHTTVNGQLQLSSLTTEYLHEPLGLDVRQPRFSWQLHSIGDGRGYSQTAYRIKVADERGNQVWDSGKVNSGEALGIVYKGADLAPRTRYTWDLTVWDQDNSEYSTGSWFETALLNADPAASAWNGAEWIGGGGEDLQLYSHYLSVFRLNYGLQLDQASATSHASFIIGANDARLMDKDLNI